MKAMLGTADLSTLPLKKASDQKTLTATVASDGTKQFELSAEPIRWEYQKDKTITAWGFNGQVPGPEIRVTEGDKVRINFTNNLPKATTVHWHGLDVPNSMDGVPGVTQDAIKPGESFSYEFTATPGGTRFYHTHGSTMGDEAQQSDMGLSGAFIVEPSNYQKPDKEFTVVLDDWLLGENGFNNSITSMVGMDGTDTSMPGMDMSGSSGSQSMAGMDMAMDYNLFTMNGLAFPDTKPMEVQKGDKVRIRLINASASTIHPMHLHGTQFKIVATDGNPVPEAAQLTKNVITVSPGETYDIEFTATNPGTWAFHCHELHHAGAGMMNVLKVSDQSTTDSTGSTMPESMPGMDMDDMPGMDMNNMPGM